MNPKSVPPPSLKKYTRDEAKKLILGSAANSLRPMIVGTTAVRLGSCWSLEETEEVFQELVHLGLMRPLNKAEKLRFDLREGYVLTGVDSVR